MIKKLGIALIVAGAIFMVAGVATWATVQSELSDENITVAKDADWFANDHVDGPLTAYSEAEIIQKHALEATDGNTYAQLDREDPRRQTMASASFLRASLFTSVVAFGVAAMSIGVGIVFLVQGIVMVLVARNGRL